jgi:carbon-monoxide dehydrogenase large subunit
MVTGAIGERPAFVGVSVPRVEDARYVAGEACYVDDIQRPDMLHAAFVRSVHPHARVLRVDVAPALELGGVVAAFSGADLCGHYRNIEGAMALPEVATIVREPLVTDRTRHVGDPVAVIIAKSRSLAEDGAEMVAVDWEPLPAVIDALDAMHPDAPTLDPNAPANTVAHMEHPAVGRDMQGVHTFTKHLRHGRSAPAPLETRGMVAEYDRRAGVLTIWSSHQAPHGLKALLSPLIGVSHRDLRVISPDVGGGFGLKGQVYPEDVVIPVVARILGQPVKWIADRWEDMAAGCHTKEMTCDISFAVDANARFRSVAGHFISNAGAYAAVPTSALIDASAATTMLPSLYEVDDAAYSLDVVLTNKSQLGAGRGIGWTPAQTARELLIEEIAWELDVDPVELRLRNCIGSEPRLSALGLAYDGGSYAASLQAAAHHLAYVEFRERQSRLRREGRYVGIGFSPFIEPTGISNEYSHATNTPFHYFDTVEVTMEPDGSVTVTSGFHSHGQGHETTFAQLAAGPLGVSVEDVRVRYGDTAASAWGLGTYGSRTAVIATGAIQAAADVIRERLLEAAATMLEANPLDIELTNGHATVVGSPQQSIEIAAIARFAYFGAQKRPETIKSEGLTARRGYDPPQTYSNGTCAAIVDVDIETGQVRVERIVAVEDCGVMINPAIVEGQIAGAVVNGVGVALLEETVYGDDGNFLGGTFLDYLCPTATDVPEIEIVHIETPSPVTASGVKGLGEAGTIAAPAAVIIAVADALRPFGVRIDKVPLTPNYLWELVRNATSAAVNG